MVVTGGNINEPATLNTLYILTHSKGSEAGHATGEYSHGNGYKMDFQKNAGLDGYITSSFARIADRGDGYAQWQAGSGNIYCVSLCSLSTGPVCS